MNTNKEIAALFLKLGCISFGGPAAHVAMMERETVTKRKWLSSQEFMDLLAVSNLIPGPGSTELSMHIGYSRGGWKGLFIAGACFIFPAVLATLLIAIFLDQLSSYPLLAYAMTGIKASVIAIIIVSVLPLLKKSSTTPFLIAIGIIALLAAFSGINQIIVLLSCGVLGIFSAGFIKEKRLNSLSPLIAVIPFTTLFLKFLKVGALLYGSGYVLLSYLDEELVQNGYLSAQQLLDGISVGQFTPGPVLSTATYIGYQLRGLQGAALATAGIFLPSFIFVLISAKYISTLRQNKIMSRFLDAVNVASLALIMHAVYTLGTATFHHWTGICIFAAALILLLCFRNVNSALIILGGALAGISTGLI
jgi:chromate transporter